MIEDFNLLVIGDFRLATAPFRTDGPTPGSVDLQKDTRTEIGNTFEAAGLHYLLVSWLPFC